MRCWLGGSVWISWLTVAHGASSALEVLQQAEEEYLQASREADLAEKRLADYVQVLRDLEESENRDSKLRPRAAVVTKSANFVAPNEQAQQEYQNRTDKHADKFAILETDEERDWALQMRDISSVLETDMEGLTSATNSPPDPPTSGTNSQGSAPGADKCDELDVSDRALSDKSPDEILGALNECAQLLQGHYDKLVDAKNKNLAANEKYKEEFLIVWNALKTLKSGKLETKFKEEHTKVVDALIKMTNILHSKSMGDLYNADLRPWHLKKKGAPQARGRIINNAGAMAA
mmetsp:Transcript_72506/g.125788  ORF Transcript_72506/g.125788 Transcript_72506/m.125788 type:complete len:290 (-) Transcript_72506:71-940(-)